MAGAEIARPAGAQQAAVEAASPASAAPQTVIRWSGSLPEAAGRTVQVRFAIYQDQAGGLPLWRESQTVKVGADGRYSVLLGVTSPEGLPQTLFQGGDARWIEARIVSEAAEIANAPGRSLLAAVPYAFKSIDAETLAGRSAADYVTREDLESAVAGGMQAAALAHPDTNPAPVTGAGTTGYVPVWSGAATLGNSVISQTASNIGIKTATPAADLDVNGATDLRGAIKLGSQSAAIPTTGVNSAPLEFMASAYSTATSAAVAQTFQLQSIAWGNDTASPSAKLELLFGSAGAVPAATGLSINPNGQINFAAGQKFPGTGAGTITGVTATSPLTGGGTTGAVSVGLNTAALETTLNAAYAQLNAPNTFTKPITFAAGQSFPGAAGGIAAVKAGTGLTGGGNTGTVNLAVDPTVVPLLSADNYFPQGANFGGPVLSTVSNFSVNAAISGEGTNGVIGVYGTSDTFSGGMFSNTSQTAAAVEATNYATGTGATSPIAVFGFTPWSNTLAVEGNAGGDNSTGVLGTVGGGSSVGVNGQASGADSWGVLGSVTGPADIGVQGKATGNNSIAVQGSVDGTGSTGVQGTTIQDDTIGVGGFASGKGGAGLYGGAAGWIDAEGILPNAVQGTAVYGIGVLGSTYGLSSNFKSGYGTATTAGVWGDTAAEASNKQVAAAVVGTADGGAAANFSNTSPSQYALTAVNFQKAGWGGSAGYMVNWSDAYSTLSLNNLVQGGPTEHGIFRTLIATTPDGTCGFGGRGDMSCTGQVKTLVSTGGGARKVETYAMQSPENWMEDFGSGTLQRGVAAVKIDPAFAETVSETADYHVFLTPRGDSKGLYVIDETATGFEVRESGGGVSSLSFDYRIVAKRRGFEAERLTDVTERFNDEVKRNTDMARESLARTPARRSQTPSPAPPPPQAAPQMPAMHRLPVIPHVPANRKAAVNRP